MRAVAARNRTPPHFQVASAVDSRPQTPSIRAIPHRAPHHCKPAPPSVKVLTLNVAPDRQTSPPAKIARTKPPTTRRLMFVSLRFIDVRVQPLSKCSNEINSLYPRHSTLSADLQILIRPSVAHPTRLNATPNPAGCSYR